MRPSPDKNKNLAGVVWQQNKEILWKWNKEMEYKNKEMEKVKADCTGLDQRFVQFSDQQPVHREEDHLWW